MVFDFQINFDKQRKLQRKNSPWGLFRNVKFGIFFSSHALIVRRYYKQDGFMTYYWKACEPNKLKMPACKLYLVPGPRNTAFLQPPLKRPAHPEPHQPRRQGTQLPLVLANLTQRFKELV